MGYSNSEFIEETLIESHRLGINREVIKLVEKILSEDPKRKESKSDVYFEAFNKIKKKVNG